MPTFTPKKEEELSKREFPVWPAGIYDFEIAGAIDKVSKAAKARGETEPNMTELVLRIFNDNLDEIKVFDYLLFTDDHLWKLRHCCDAIGILAKYEGGDLVAGDFEGGTGKVKIRIQPAKDGYSERNAVVDYVLRQPKPSADLKDDLADDIPFM